MLKRWERYFIHQLLAVSFLFLTCFYGLYVLIDYANHTSHLAHHTTQILGSDFLSYYSYVFATRAEILIPLALLIALIKTVTTLNVRHELTALMAAGVSLKRLMRPFIGIGCIAVVLLYLNEQFILPNALVNLRQIESKTRNQKHGQSTDLAVHTVILADGSRLLFQSYDALKEHFSDVYWIESIDSIYRMKALSHTQIPTGHFVDHLVRQPSGELLQQTAYASLSLPHLRFNEEILQSTIFEPEMHSLTELFDHYFQLSSDLNEKESKTLTALYWKALIPWLCLLAIIAPIPFCVQFSRQFPFFLIYVCCLFGLIAFYMLIDASQIVTKKQVLSPVWALGLPFGLVFSYFGWRYFKLE